MAKIKPLKQECKSFKNVQRLTIIEELAEKLIANQEGLDQCKMKLLSPVHDRHLKMLNRMHVILLRSRIELLTEVIKKYDQSVSPIAFGPLISLLPDDYSILEFQSERELMEH